MVRQILLCAQASLVLLWVIQLTALSFAGTVSQFPCFGIQQRVSVRARILVQTRTAAPELIRSTRRLLQANNKPTNSIGGAVAENFPFDMIGIAGLRGYK